MKSSSQCGSKKRLYFSILSLLIFMLSCAPPQKYLDVSANFNKANYKKIGLMVLRVGAQDPSGVSLAIPTLETDYSNRSPQSAKTGFDGSISKLPVPVYIEDEERLKESFPYYPKTTESPTRGLGTRYAVEFYDNLTPQLYSTVEKVLKHKGYTVVDLQKASNSWRKPIPESSVGEIIGQASSLVDAILLVQYMDIGNTSSKEGSYSLSRTGLSDIEYNVSLFDCGTRERVISFRKDYFPAFLVALKNDPAIMADPEKKNKFIIYEHKSFYTNNPIFDGVHDIETVVTNLVIEPFVRSDMEKRNRLATNGASVTTYDNLKVTSRWVANYTKEELVEFLMKYIEKGTKHDMYNWTGLDEVIP